MVTDVLAAVLTREIDPGTLPHDVPSRVRWVLERCFVRDPKLRLRDIGGARVALANLETVPHLPLPAGTHPALTGIQPGPPAVYLLTPRQAFCSRPSCLGPPFSPFSPPVIYPTSTYVEVPAKTAVLKSSPTHREAGLLMVRRLLVSADSVGPSGVFQHAGRLAERRVGYGQMFTPLAFGLSAPLLSRP